MQRQSTASVLRALWFPILLTLGALVFVAYQVEEQRRLATPCDTIKADFERAIHYTGQDRVGTTINGQLVTEYSTRGYSGPNTVAEEATMGAALKSWRQASCQGPINPNMEFWHD